MKYRSCLKLRSFGILKFFGKKDIFVLYVSKKDFIDESIRSFMTDALQFSKMRSLLNIILLFSV